jgi:hypothetical protein
LYSINESYAKLVAYFWAIEKNLCLMLKVLSVVHDLRRLVRLAYLIVIRKYAEFQAVETKYFIAIKLKSTN